jgi:hypothetical protein
MKEYPGKPMKVRERPSYVPWSNRPCGFGICGGFAPSFGGGGTLSLGGFSGSFANAGASSQSFNSAGSSGFGSTGLLAPSIIITSPRPSGNFGTFHDPVNNEVLVKKPIEIRTEFPETWIFDAFEMDAK